MTELTASRTLVKSPPELWAECSDAASLGRHLDQFGEIRITRLEPETAVAWEGEHASGTVRLEPSGWGTRVVLTAQPVGGAAAAQPEVAPETETAPEPDAETARNTDPEPAAEIEAAPEPDPDEPPRRVGTFARLMRWLKGPTPPPAPPADPQSEELPPAAEELPPAAEALPPAAEEPAAAPVGEEPDRTSSEETANPAAAALEEALESLGQAHHRPFSRS